MELGEDDLIRVALAGADRDTSAILPTQGEPPVSNVHRDAKYPPRVDLLIIPRSL
jgi:hypothetical protein